MQPGAKVCQHRHLWLLLWPESAPCGWYAPRVLRHGLCRLHACSSTVLQTTWTQQPAGNGAWPRRNPACPALQASLQPAQRLGAASALLHASRSNQAARMLACDFWSAASTPMQPASQLPAFQALLAWHICLAADMHVHAASAHALHPHQAALVLALRLDLVPHAVHLSTGEGHHAVPPPGMPQRTKSTLGGPQRRQALVGTHFQRVPCSKHQGLASF